MTKELMKTLCITKRYPCIPSGVEIPSYVTTRAELSDWLIEDLGFNCRDPDYREVFRLLRENFPPGEPSELPDPVRAYLHWDKTDISSVPIDNNNNNNNSETS